ncbi:MAG TPA: ABC transporter, partial [Arthrobacter sp.]|nr:ABC transporter [Arthrobacter sp.]
FTGAILIHVLYFLVMIVLGLILSTGRLRKLFLN